MTLRRRTVLATILSVGMIMAALVGAYRFILASAYASLERQEAMTELSRTHSVLMAEIRALDVVLTDWASWDDAYDYVVSRDKKFEESNLPGEILSQLRLNVLVIRNSAGENVAARGAGPDGKPVAIPGLTDRIDPASPLLRLPKEGAQSGFVQTSLGPIFVSVRPILMSDGSGAPRGVVLMGRLIDEAFVARLSETLQLGMSLVPPDASALPPEVRAALPALPVDGATTSIRSDDRIAAYCYIRDLDGKPIAVLGVETDRSIARQGASTLRALLVTVAATGVILIVVLSFAIDASVVRRLRTLRRDMEHIGSRGAGTGGGRAAVTGHDEIAEVAGGINDMLDRLDLATQEQARLFERVTEQRRLVDEALRQMVEGIVVLDPEGRCTICNPAAGRLLGREPASVVGKLWTEVAPPLIPADAPTRSAGGEMYHMGQRAVAVSQPSDPAGPGLSVIVLRDVTEVRDVEALKRDLVATVSHELRTPLTAIRATVGLLREPSAGALSEVHARLVELLVSNTDRLWVLVDDLLDMAALEGGRVALFRDAAYVNPICERVIEDLHGSAAQASVSLVRDLRASHAAYLDAGRMRQVIENLVSNALKFTPAGGEVTVITRSDDEHVLIEVRDTGIGIEHADLERIFEKFYRTRRASAFARGTGLGLSIARSIVELHGGRLYAQSDGEHGTTMIIELPVSPMADLSVVMDDPAE